jgi:3',5'-cyclic AMP phosphodiesterase CpdA
MDIDLRLAQISDIHMSRRPDDGMVLQAEAGRLLAQAITQINALPGLDCVLVTGDLVDKGTPGELDDVLAQLTNLRVPWNAIPGNHDIASPPNPDLLDRRRFFEQVTAAAPAGTDAYEGAAERGSWTILLKPGVRLVALDSNIPGDWSGVINAAQLAWLETTLEAAPEPLVVLMVHHPLHKVFGGWERPEFAGQDWNKFFCNNGAEVRALLDRYPQVRLVLTGHDHVSRVDQFKGRLHIAAPALSSYPLAFRTIHVHGIERGWTFTWQTYTPAKDDLLAEAQAKLETGTLGQAFAPADPHRFAVVSEGQASDRQGRLQVRPRPVRHGR